MNSQQAIKKCQKKAWTDIKIIQSAPNMLAVESAINNAIEKTFGLYNEGLLIVGMKKLGQMGELEFVMRIHRQDFSNCSCIVRSYLIDLIPSRFHNTLMYRKLIGSFPVF